MVGTSNSRVFQQQSPWESFATSNHMITQHKQHEFLPDIKNPLRASTTNWGLNGLGFSPLIEGDHMHESNGPIRAPAFRFQGPFLTPNEYFEEQTSVFPSKGDVQPSTCVAPSLQEKKFVIFDQCGNDTRMIFSSLCAPLSSLGAQQFPPQQLNKQEQTQVCIETPIASDESRENETVDEGSEMREDTDEINALLYSDDEDNADAEDDEVSTGHSPLAKWEERDFDEVASIGVSSKRQKVFDGGFNKVQNDQLCENAIGEDLICSHYEEFDPTVGNKRPRKDKIRDTLRALKSIMPDVKSTDPLVILEEAISYLKTLKSNAQTIFIQEEDPDSSSCCYGPSI